MRKTVNGKSYNTDTAKVIGSVARDGASETLYRKKNGIFFLAMPHDKIVPLTVEMAKGWVEAYLGADIYQSLFGDKGKKRVACLSLSADVYDEIERISQKTKLNKSQVVERLVMGNYVTRDTEAGNVIDRFRTRKEAEQAIAKYEEEDKKDGSYTENFYEVYEENLWG